MDRRVPLHLIEGMDDYQDGGAKLSLNQINFGKNVVIPKMAWKEVQDMMVNPENGEPHTAHTTNLVPCYLINGPDGAKLRPGGKLADIAPTILELLKIKKPIEMDGESLLI